MKKQLLLLAMFLLPLVLCAHNIEAQSAEGVTIYYNYINNATELEVTYGWYSYFDGDNYQGNVVIPEEVTCMNRTLKVTRIGNYAFYRSSGLTSVTIPNSVTSIGNMAFQDCSGLTSVTIGTSVTSIGSMAFSGCSKLTSITIPNSVTTIGISAFEGCSGLTSVTIPNSVTSIGDFAFKDCSGLTSITIPESMTEISRETFSGCSGLTSVAIPNSISYIGSHAFYKCSNLPSITIPISVTNIGKMAFANCSGLTSIVIPNSVKKIGDGAFYECSNITSVTIGSSVTEIGKRAFYWWANNITIISLIEKPFGIDGGNSANSPFGPTTYKNSTLYVPIGTKQLYQHSRGWWDFQNIVEGIPTGIEAVTDSKQEPVSYYSLDGRKIDSPKSGTVVVKKQGNRMKKVLIK